jgi:chromate transporter
MTDPRLRDIVSTFARIGNLTFGGGDPTMLALQRETTGRRAWMTPEQFGLVYGLARVTPGTNVLALCAGAGWVMRGWRGAVLALAAACAPSAVMAIVLLQSIETGMANPWIAAAMATVNAAVVGLMASGAWMLIRPHLRGGWLRAIVLTSAAGILASPPLRWSPIPVLLVALAAGLLWRARPSQ